MHTMVSTYSFFVIALVSSVVVPILGQNSTVGNNANFTGPGYLSCPIVDFDAQECMFDVNPTCTNFASCNFSVTEQFIPTVDVTSTYLYVPLVCDCYVATFCPDSCTINTGETPTLPPITSGRANFTGIGSVTCPFIDVTRVPCTPEILNDDVTTCGTCDFDVTDDEIGYTFGDDEITFPLPCECLVMYNCPDTCVFTAQVSNGTAPTPAVTTPVAAPTTSTSTPVVAVPASVPVGSTAMPVVAGPSDGGENVTSVAPESTPVSVPVPLSTTPVSGPISTSKAPVTRAPVVRSPSAPTAGSGPTSASFHTTILSCMMVMIVSTLVVLN